MKNILLITFVLLVLFLVGKPTFANHIVGGELRMRPLGSGIFEISLIQYWDEKNLIIPTSTVSGNRDPTAEIYIYSKKNNTLMDRLTATYRSTSQIEYQNKACATIRSLQTLTGTYTGTINLNSSKYNDSEGYYIVWERCCRNDDINNIVSPGENGMTFYLEFPPLTINNNLPEFQAPNGQYICINRDFSMNMSAVDADGDELRYSLVTPMRGNTSPDDPVGNDSRKNGYPLITWGSGISLSNIIPGTQPLSIGSDGILKVNANRIGLYVFTIQCEELRNGKRIGLVRRDFQLLVIDCNDDTPELPLVMVDDEPIKEVSICPQKPVELETEASSDWSYQWQLNGLNIPGATKSNLMVSDTGNYSVIKSFSQKCSRDTASSIVHVSYQDIEAVITVDTPVFCEGKSAVLFANGGTLADNLAASWSLDNVLLLDTNPKIEISKPGLYQLVITDQLFGCTGTDTTTIKNENVSVVLPDKISLLEGSSATLKPEVTPNNLVYTYLWSPTDGIIGDAASSVAVVSPQVSTAYTVQVFSSNGCSDSTTIQVNVIDKMHIPTAFSPNNDGVNDSFEIFNAKDQIETIEIYNRWGEVIYHSNGYDVPWNGIYKNKLVPAGSYPYIIKTNEVEYKGEVILLK